MNKIKAITVENTFTEIYKKYLWEGSESISGPGSESNQTKIISENLIIVNNKKFSNNQIKFTKLDILTQDLPMVDLIICRDLLVHFPYKDIFIALKNIIISHSKYILTTTFAQNENNSDIKIGEWRPVNLTTSPINLPAPLLIFEENCTENNGIYSDKSLGLWKIKELLNI